jgi:glycosyltransferase involved in cell wall biosynthesis
MSNPELVSVLMPAFKPEFFKEALLSVVNQTHDNLEILIGDNSGRTELREIIEEVDDPRIIHIPAHQVTHRSPRINHMLLWWRAKGRYVRYVYDDDIIYPRSTEVLLDQIKRAPGCVMSWHQREIIDKDGNTFLKLDYIGELEEIFLDRALLLDNLIKRQNFIGEPSFILLDKSIFRHFDFQSYEGVEIVFHWDVALYLEAAKYGLLTGNRQFLGCFRKHPEQMSSTLKDMFVPLEWELILRNENNRGNLSQEGFEHMVATVLYDYQLRRQSFPILGKFREDLISDLKENRLFESTQRFVSSFNELAQSQ